MEIMNMYISWKLIIMISLFIVSEVILAIRIKKSQKDDSIWLAINFVIPVIGCLIYVVTHKPVKE